MQKLPDESRKIVQTCHPLDIAAQVRESTAPIGSHKLIGFLEHGTAEGTLQQTQSDDFGVGEPRGIIIGASPSGPSGMLFEIIVHEDINPDHLMGNERYYTVRRVGFPLADQTVVT